MFSGGARVATIWMIRSGQGGRNAQTRIEAGDIRLGWDFDLDPTKAQSKHELAQSLRRVDHTLTERQADVGASQVWRFLKEVAVGDCVVTYEPESRRYHVGTIESGATFHSEAETDSNLSRRVAWKRTVDRDAVSPTARNTLGAILTIFKLTGAAAAELGAIQQTSGEPRSEPDPITPSPERYTDIEEQALERIKDRLNALSWQDMQEMVAAILRAMGYRTIVSPPGSDRGRDIIASPDGLGLQHPRIAVEVKHRKGQMGAPDIRAFLGGRHSEDRGLYVSTGGFAREAYYEAERATTPTHLMTLDGLARALIEHYDKVDARGQALLPLQKIYWPA